MLKITRANDSRVVKAILHRVADIPGGVTVSVATLGGVYLKEGTPIGAPDGSTGLCKVSKTAKIITNATSSAVTYDVAKDHHFKVGDYFAAGGASGQVITAIDKTTNTDKDVITVGTTLGAAITAGTDGAIAFQTTGVNTTLSVSPVAIVGSNYDVEALTQLFVDAWIIAVVKDGNAPTIPTAIKTILKGIFYI
jgi:hypothetical protein